MISCSLRVSSREISRYPVFFLKVVSYCREGSSIGVITEYTVKYDYFGDLAIEKLGRPPPHASNSGEVRTSGHLSTNLRHLGGMPGIG